MEGGLTVYRLVIIAWLIVSVLNIGHCQAGVKEEYDQAHKIYLAAGACMAAYSDRYGQLTNKYLERENWQIERFNQTGDYVDSRFLLARKQLNNGQQTYILAFVGTENEKDMKANLQVEKVYFAGSNLEEFAKNADKHEMPSTEPKIHRGFNEFVQKALKAKGQDVDGQTKYLTEMLLADKERKVLLVGHSRGGAAATLTGARLISMGVQPEQIEIITFGAPAVGNEAFASRFAPLLNLTRIVLFGDPVTGVLQTMVGGYKQFGRQLTWESPATADFPHDMTAYADVAIKRYYDAREQAQQAGLMELPRVMVLSGGSERRVYVAPLINHLPVYLSKEFGYLREIIFDEYRQILPEYIIAAESDIGQLRKKAREAGCKWLIVPEVSGYRMKEERNVYNIALLQAVYDVNTGNIVKAAGFSTGTYNLTPLEAFIHITKDMTYDWLIKR
jgi:predicted lipase